VSYLTKLRTVDNGHSSRKNQKRKVGLVVKATFNNLVSMAETLLTKRLQARKWTAGSESSITVKLLSQKVICKKLLRVQRGCPVG
jgi:hypothetical protein